MPQRPGPFLQSTMAGMIERSGRRDRRGGKLQAVQVRGARNLVARHRPQREIPLHPSHQANPDPATRLRTARHQPGPYPVNSSPRSMDLLRRRTSRRHRRPPQSRPRNPPRSLPRPRREASRRRRTNRRHCTIRPPQSRPHNPPRSLPRPRREAPRRRRTSRRHCTIRPPQSRPRNPPRSLPRPRREAPRRRRTSRRDRRGRTCLLGCGEESLHLGFARRDASEHPESIHRMAPQHKPIQLLWRLSLCGEVGNCRQRKNARTQERKRCGLTFLQNDAAGRLASGCPIDAEQVRTAIRTFTPLGALAISRARTQSARRLAVAAVRCPSCTMIALGGRRFAWRGRASEHDQRRGLWP
jgi:hypothetical protein